ncbi:MAG: hypothetical protein WC783_04315 [Candidatus Paceibacterota bacterium]|jgi:hypothetical protein
MEIQIHNAKKVTYDGSDYFLVCLCDDSGNLLFDRANRCYDEEATSGYSKYDDAVDYAKALAKRRVVKRIYDKDEHRVLWSATKK